ncbi:MULTISPECIES: hypothetical protein [unclassified Pseudomonas]|nr:MULTISPECIES: hypothetical protein [unclassified Pseudomonas]MDG9927449.1 hypothetical protein [Pseudomonas sp. GD04042]MDH0482518.1 hypothetical protein [Pseudomonas sp. GD04015]MDH0602870.1 hypothetical protein [Pseudomonas sp. GD03869]
MTPAQIRQAVRLLSSLGIHTNRDLLEQVLDKGKRLREVRHARR